MDLYIKHSRACSSREKMMNGIIKELLNSHELNSDFILISKQSSGIDRQDSPTICDSNCSDIDESQVEKKPENYMLECINDDLIAYSRFLNPDDQDKWL